MARYIALVEHLVGMHIRIKTKYFEDDANSINGQPKPQEIIVISLTTSHSQPDVDGSPQHGNLLVQIKRY